MKRRDSVRTMPSSFLTVAISSETQLAKEALRMNASLGRKAGLLSSRILLGAISLATGAWKDAVKELEDVFGETTDGFQKSIIRRYLALAYCAGCDFEKALTEGEASYRFAHGAEDSEGEGQALLIMAEIHLRAGRTKDAIRVGKEALLRLGLTSSLLLAADAERVVGEALVLEGKVQEGIEKILSAIDNLRGADRSIYMAKAERALASAYDIAGDYRSTDKYLKRALEGFRASEARYEYGLTLLTAAQCAKKRGSFVKARRFLSEAARIFKDLEVESLHKRAVSEMESTPGGEAQVRAVSLLSKISQTLISSYDLNSVLNLAMDLAMEYLGADRGVLMLRDDSTGELADFVQRGMDTDSVEEVVGISKSIVESVQERAEPIVSTNVRDDPRFQKSKSIRMHNIMSVMCLPLMRGDRLIGIIYLDNRGVPSKFTELERAFVEAFANQVALAIENVRTVGRLRDDFDALKALTGQKYSFTNIIGPGKKMQEVFRQVEKAAQSTIAVLITGESGTGKELIAGLLHELSPRKDKPMIKVNCAAIQKDLLETELFGIEKSVATGIAPRSGYFERANGGTIFLDEIGDMPLTTQMKVLRVLAEQEFERVGGTRVIKVDVRVISATNRDLRELIEKGEFRKELYYRLNGMRIHLPALRERMEDLPALVDYFIRKYCAMNSKPIMQPSESTMQVLKQYQWPGNIRELEKCIEHAVVISDGKEILPEHLPHEVVENVTPLRLGWGESSAPGVSLPERLRRIERELIIDALESADWVKVRAAEKLGIHESTLRKKMRLLGISERTHKG